MMFLFGLPPALTHIRQVYLISGLIITICQANLDMSALLSTDDRLWFSGVHLVTEYNSLPQGMLNVSDSGSGGSELMFFASNGLIQNFD